MAGPNNSRRKKKVKVDEVDDMLAGAFGMSPAESDEDYTSESKVPNLPPSGPPGSPPSDGPSKGPPSGPPGSPPSDGPSSGPPKEVFKPPTSGPPSAHSEEESVTEEELMDSSLSKITKTPIIVEEEPSDEGPIVEVPTSVESFVNPEEIENLRNEVERLRSGLASAGEVISEIEEVPHPPIVGPDYVVAAHLVSDFIRTGRLLHRERLVRASQGSISILDPDEPGLVHASKSGCMLGRILEGDIITGRLGQPAPENAPIDWRIHEVMLAFASLQYEGPAACVYTPSSNAIALSLDKKLIKMEPVDEIGKANFGKAVIVDPNYDNMDDFLRQITDALRQGNSKAACIRGVGVYAVGRNFDEAWNNCAILEHSSEIILLARNSGINK